LIDEGRWRIDSLLTLLEVLWGSVDKFQSDKLEASQLKTLDDVADEPTLDTVGLHD
jgi:hypothetical protein